MGRIGRPHGLRGAVVVEPVTDEPEKRFAVGSNLLTSEGSTLTVARYEATDRAPIVTFVGVGDRTGADLLRGSELFIRVGERRRLDADEFWPDELVGMVVVSPSGEPLGVVSDVEIGVGQDRLLIDTPRGQVPLPFVEELVPVVDLPARRVVAVLPEGLSR